MSNLKKAMLWSIPVALFIIVPMACGFVVQTLAAVIISAITISIVPYLIKLCDVWSILYDERQSKKDK